MCIAKSYLIECLTNNPSLMVRLINDEVVDVGDGLSIAIAGYTHFNPISSSDSIEFSFLLEGRHIGYLDNDLGGLIHPRYSEYNELSEEKQEAGFNLMSEVTNKLLGLFPNLT